MSGTDTAIASYLNWMPSFPLLFIQWIYTTIKSWFNVILFSHVFDVVNLIMLPISKIAGITFHGKMVPNKQGNLFHPGISERQFQFTTSCPTWKTCHCDKYEPQNALYNFICAINGILNFVTFNFDKRERFTKFRRRSTVGWWE